METLTTVLVAAGSSVATIFLTPWLQNNFWRYQRRDEFRLAAIQEFNRLATEAITGVYAAAGPYRASLEWFTRVNTVAATIRALFSTRAVQAVEAFDEM